MRSSTDLTGHVFGRLTVLRRGPKKGKKLTWVCACACGNTTEPITRSNLVTGNTASCGCHRKELMNWAEDLTGRVFGYLTVTGLGPTIEGHQAYTCRCVCGTEKDILKKHLVEPSSKSVKSCGCMRIAAITKHGHNRKKSPSPEYVAWSSMLLRCRDPNQPQWSDYGGRGIDVCERWLDFRNFLDDMGAKPSPDHSVERRKNHLGYSPENCVWATRVEQARNKRNNLVLSFRGEEKCLAAWCEELNLDYAVARSRIRDLHWPVERALTTPTPKPYRHYADIKAAKSSAKARLTVTPATPSP